MAPKPFFSIIIPTLNEEKFLPHLLADLSRQTFKEFEVVVVDAKSKDKTLQTATSFKIKLPQLTLIQSSQKNVSYQRNLGAKHSQGNILLFLDADTQLPRPFLKQVKRAFATKKPDVLTTWTKADSNLDKDRVIATSSNLTFEISKFLRLPVVYGAMLAIRKFAFKKIGGFNPKVSYGEDTQLLQKVVRAGYKYIILRNTYYILSLRRYRKEGTLNTIRKYAQLNLNTIFNGYENSRSVDYPMGGHLFRSPPPTTPSVRWFKQTLERTKQALKPKKAGPQFQQFLKQLFEEPEIKR